MTDLIWHVEKRKLSKLKIWGENPRTITVEGSATLKDRFVKRGVHDTLKADTDGTLISGNQRKEVLEKMGIKEVYVMIPNRKLSKKEKQEVAIESNLHDGSWDKLKLASFGEIVLEDVKFPDLDSILTLDVVDNFDEEKAIKEAVKKPHGVKLYDTWKLGQHILGVGDCTQKIIWEGVLEKEKFDFLFTDPPYLIGANLGKTKVGSHDWKFKIKTKSGFGYKGMRRYEGLAERGGVPSYDSWLSIANEFQNPKGANVMVFENWRNSVLLWQALEKYWRIKNQIIWWLPNRSQGFSAPHKFFSKYDIAPLAGEGVLNAEYEKELEDYLTQKGQKLLDTYEVCLYGQKGKSFWDKNKGTTWARVNDHVTWVAETGKSSGQRLIFGTKPIQVLTPFVKILSPRDGIVAEPFCGSGSTLISCEIMKRQCRAIEAQPLYAEVIVSRFERFTGQKAVKIGEIKAPRATN